jgi:hypothetical protein
MEDFTARQHRESIEEVAIARLLDDLKERFEKAEADLLKNEDPHDRRQTDYCSGIKQSFSRVYTILNEI